jgi:hypothetical protein
MICELCQHKCKYLVGNEMVSKWVCGDCDEDLVRGKEIIIKKTNKCQTKKLEKTGKLGLTLVKKS